MAAIISISTLIPLISVANHFLIWRHLSDMDHQPQLSAISIWQKQCQIYFSHGNLITNECNDCYLYTKFVKVTLKPNSYLMSIFRRGPVNPSALTCPNTSLTRIMANVLVLWKSLKKTGIISISSRNRRPCWNWFVGNNWITKKHLR